MALLPYTKVLLQRNPDLPDPAGPFWASLSSAAIEGSFVLLGSHCHSSSSPWKRPTHQYTCDCHERNTLSILVNCLSVFTQHLQRVEYLGGKFGSAQNKSSEHLAQYHSNTFGKFFPRQKFLAIRHIQLFVCMYILNFDRLRLKVFLHVLMFFPGQMIESVSTIIESVSAYD